MRWHYSHRMPQAKLVTFGAWEAGDFIGAVIFGRGATSDLGKPYGLSQTECAELVRVALRKHENHVTAVIARSLRQLKAGSPGLRLIISFADPEHGHRGGIYQAGNWIYLGPSQVSLEWSVQGRRIHARQISHRLHGRPSLPGESRLEYVRRTMDPNAEAALPAPKHRYAYPLDRAMRRQLAPLAKPYPAAEVSTATRHAPGEERQVRALPAAPQPTKPPPAAERHGT